MSVNRVIYEILSTFRARGSGSQDDGRVLNLFIEKKDPAAFEVLVQRHGPMVLGVCRRILASSHDAEDAFQATFLVLVRKAVSIIPREVVGNWLYGVAYNVARKARAIQLKRHGREMQLESLPEPGAPEDAVLDLRELLDEEVSRLPRKYRIPMILCSLEGRTNKEAAQELGWPEGTVSGRLTRARKLLAKRLAQRGLPLLASSASALVSERASLASVPISLAASTTRLATQFAARFELADPAIPANVAALAKAGMLGASSKRLISITVTVILGCVLSAGGLLAHHRLNRSDAQPDDSRIPAKTAERPIPIHDDPADRPMDSKKPPPPADSDQAQPPPEEIVAAWKAAGVRHCWRRVYNWGLLDFITYRGDGGLEDPEPGDLLSFGIGPWKNGCLAKVPTPATPFGLNLCASNVTDDGLKELARHQSLHTLCLRYCPVTDAGMKALAALKNLHTLDLGGTKVTDAGLKQLAGLKNLHTLYLVGTRVGDAGLKDLPGMTSLHTLNLGDTDVTDIGLKDLARLKTLRSLNVGELHVDGTKITDVGLKELRRALHACNIWPPDRP
jgi:RNA polymerase sigma factor (sigma-70 family)